MADLVEAHAPVIGEVMTHDNGFPLTSSVMIARHLALELFRLWRVRNQIAGESFSPERPRGLASTSSFRDPLGVVGAIIPWNAPAGMIALKMAPALAAGCTLVLKTDLPIRSGHSANPRSAWVLSARP